MPSPIWLLTVAAYWAVVGLCLYAAIKRVPQRRPLSIMCGILASLTINKQHDLTGIVTRLLRNAAWRDGWYRERTTLQVAIIGSFLIILFLAVAAVWMLATRLRRSPGQRIILTSIVYLACFAGARAVSLHQGDWFLSQTIGGIQLNAIFEFTGLALAVTGILLCIFQKEDKHV